MKKFKNWVCHRNKIPIDPKTGNAAKSNDPSTWGSYEQAKKLMECDKTISGLGFMFTNSPYVGIDIDHCIQDDKTSEFAHKIITTFQSYTEISPSGTGIHIICKGKLEGAGRKNSELGLEIYDTGRYFTVTENAFKAYPNVLECQKEINELCKEYFTEKKSKNAPKQQQQICYLEDEKLLEMAKNSKNGIKFSALYAGNWQNYYQSQSEADIALCNMLAFWTGRDWEQMDRIFRTSGLMRDKWNQQHGIHTYGDMTITKAVDACEEVFQPSQIRDFDNIKKVETRTEMNENNKESVQNGTESGDNTTKKTENLDRFHKFNGKGQIIGTFDAAIVDYIVQTKHIVIVGGMVYVYRDGVYRMDGQGVYIKSIIRGLIYKEFQKAYTINNIYQLLLMEHCLYKSYSEVNQYPTDWINFKNGMFDVKTFELLPHDPQYYAMNQIPHEWKGSNYDYKAEYTNHFLKTSLHEQDIVTLFEYLGYCMTQSTKFQIFLLLKGEGDNGKSILIDIFNAIIGEQNISSISMDKLTERFFSAQLLFKLCNTCADLSKVTIKDDAELKKIIAGDKIQAEFKGQNSFDFRPYAKLFFSANRFPYVDDRSEGFKRRLRVINMDKKPPKKDRELKEKIMQELDYWIFIAVLAFADALRSDEITESETGKITKEELHKESDSVYAFVKDCLVEVEGHNIRRAEMFKEYDKYCKFYERMALTKKAFFLEMQAKGFISRKTEGYYVYKNRAFTDWEIENKDLEPYS